MIPLGRALVVMVLAVPSAALPGGAGPSGRDLERELAALTPAQSQTCFVLLDLGTGVVTRVHPDECARRPAPRSMFKVFNTLAGLEAGVLKDETTSFAWDATRQPVAAWERDHTLASALRESLVWYYQRVAAGVGAERMQRYIDAVGYGNRDLSGGLTRFWLSSSLAISPDEQVAFLRRLYRDELPFDRAHQALTRRLLVLDQADGRVFSGKTGTCQAGAGSRISWFVGHLRSPHGEHVFATRIVAPVDGAGAAMDGRRARDITRALLERARS